MFESSVRLSLRSVLATAAIVTAMSTLACGIPGASVGCDFPDENGGRCQQRDGIQGVGFAPTCEASGGIALEGGCPNEGKVQGCVYDTSGDVTDWYYEPMTLEEAALECESDGTLIDP